MQRIPFVCFVLFYLFRNHLSLLTTLSKLNRYGSIQAKRLEWQNRYFPLILQHHQQVLKTMNSKFEREYSNQLIDEIRIDNIDTIFALKCFCCILSLSAGSCNGIAFWTEFNFLSTQTTIISTGPLNDMALNHFIDWDMYTRQGVHLFWKPIESNGDEVTTVPCHVQQTDDNVIYFNFA